MTTKAPYTTQSTKPDHSKTNSASLCEKHSATLLVLHNDYPLTMISLPGDHLFSWMN